MEPTTETSPVLKPGTYEGTPPTSPEKTSVPAIPVLRTMKNDIAEVITKQKETVASIALAEAKKQERLRAEALAAKQAHAEAAPPAPKRHGRIFIVILILLVLVAGRIVYKLVATNISNISLPTSGFLGFGNPATTTPSAITTASTPTPILAQALLTPQSEKRFALADETPAHIAAMISVDRTASLAEGAIRNFYFTESPSSDPTGLPGPAASSSRVLTFMGALAPDSIIPSLETPFMFGLIGEKGSVAASFIILKVSDPDIGRAAMLAWEPSLAQGFDNIFGTKIASVVPSTTKFIDLVIGGKDARVLGNMPGAIVAYAFADNSTIVITSSPTALGKIIQLLQK